MVATYAKLRAEKGWSWIFMKTLYRCGHPILIFILKDNYWVGVGRKWRAETSGYLGPTPIKLLDSMFDRPTYNCMSILIFRLDTFE